MSRSCIGPANTVFKRLFVLGDAGLGEENERDKAEKKRDGAECIKMVYRWQSRPG